MFSVEAGWLTWFWGEGRAWLIELLGTSLSVWVTIHILLRKRDVSASAGWIGLVWLSPIIGAALYFLFGINRVARRARRLKKDVQGRDGQPGDPAAQIARHLEPLERATRAITGDTAEAGNRVDMFRNGEEAYPAMLSAIAEARTSIALSTYIMRNDATGRLFFDALGDARARGIEVRVLLDGIGSGYFLPAAFGQVRRRDIPVGRFMHSPLPWRMPFLNLRTHKKLLVADGRVGFCGGMNIADENLAESHPDPVLDTHFRFEGPVVRQLMEAFARDWAFVTGEDLEGPGWFPKVADSGHAVARVVSSGPDEDLEKIAFVLLEAIACARHSIRLMTPYFLPDEAIVTALALAAIRGVEVDLLIPRVSNHRYVDWGVRAHVGPLLEAGVRIWLNRPPFDHSKLLVVDGEWCFVGSANMDMRSLRLNFELNVEVYHSDIAGRLETFMRGRSRDPLTLGDLSGRRLPVRLRDAAFRLALPYL